MEQESWDNESLGIALQMERDLDNPNSSLSHFIEALVVEEEKSQDRILKAKKDGDSLMKLIGHLAGLKKARSIPYQIVQLAKQRMDADQARRENEKVLLGVA